MRCAPKTRVCRRFRGCGLLLSVRPYVSNVLCWYIVENLPPPVFNLALTFSDLCATFVTCTQGMLQHHACKMPVPPSGSVQSERDSLSSQRSESNKIGSSYPLWMRNEYVPLDRDAGAAQVLPRKAGALEGHRTSTTTGPFGVKRHQATWNPRSDTNQGRRYYFKADGTPSRRLLLMVRLRNCILWIFGLAIIVLFVIFLPLGLWTRVDNRACGTTGISQCTLPCVVDPDADIVGIGVRTDGISTPDERRQIIKRYEPRGMAAHACYFTADSARYIYPNSLQRASPRILILSAHRNDDILSPGHHIARSRLFLSRSHVDRVSEPCARPGSTVPHDRYDATSLDHVKDSSARSCTIFGTAGTVHDILYFHPVDYHPLPMCRPRSCVQPLCQGLPAQHTGLSLYSALSEC